MESGDQPEVSNDERIEAFARAVMDIALKNGTYRLYHLGKPLQDAENEDELRAASKKFNLLGAVPEEITKRQRRRSFWMGFGSVLGGRISFKPTAYVERIPTWPTIEELEEAGITPSEE